MLQSYLKSQVFGVEVAGFRSRSRRFSELKSQVYGPNAPNLRASTDGAGCVGDNAAPAAEGTVVETDIVSEIAPEETEHGTNEVTDPEAAPDSEAPHATATAEPVTCTWWHIGTDEPLTGFWAQVAGEFEAAHPNVTVDVEAVDELRDTPRSDCQRRRPDVFQSWGGGELLDYVNNGQVKDLTEFHPSLRFNRSRASLRSAERVRAHRKPS